jgi:hypothetical protein
VKKSERKGENGRSGIDTGIFLSYSLHIHGAARSFAALRTLLGKEGSGSFRVEYDEEIPIKYHSLARELYRGPPLGDYSTCAPSFVR